MTEYRENNREKINEYSRIKMREYRKRDKLLKPKVIDETKTTDHGNPISNRAWYNDDNFYAKGEKEVDIVDNI